MSANVQDITVGNWESNWGSKWDPFVGENNAGIVREVRGALCFMPKVASDDQTPGLLAKNERNHWWYRHNRISGWSLIYLKNYQDKIDCYVLTLNREESVGIFCGVIREGIVTGIDPNGTIYSISMTSCFGTYSTELVMRAHTGSGDKFDNSVKFILKTPRTLDSIKLSYPTGLTTKNARNYQ